MKVQEFWKRVHESLKSTESGMESETAREGIAFFIADMEELFDEWDI